MTDDLAAARFVLGSRSIRDAGVVTVLAALIGVVGRIPLLVAVVLPLVLVTVSLLLRATRSPAAQEYGILPVLAGVGVLAVLATPSAIVVVLAGLAGLAVLLWNSDTPRESRRGPEPVDALLLPGVGLAVALLATFALPPANAAVGLAAVSIVAALALVLWALFGALREPGGAGEAL
ncbi:MAG: hypothetical protein L3K18_03440 [Thermoplasmata archaeon]|nr:hypothetical protein [Thermoplasmata archaeon]MCI4356186.1 hypothetical protein [Thermoplasmata archaeon]